MGELFDEFGREKPDPPSDSTEELAIQVKEILDKFEGQERIDRLVRLIQDTVLEELIFRAPSVPLRRVGSTALAANIRSVEEIEAKPAGGPDSQA